jgi:hypothetical protein
MTSDGIHQVARTATLVVADAPPVLGQTDSDGDGIDDQTEGLSDADKDGVPDYLDAVGDTTLLQTSILDGNDLKRLIRSDAGTAVVMGNLAIEAHRNGARIATTDVHDAAGNPVIDTEFSIIGGLYDFEIRGLSDAQRTARVVIPLLQPVPSNAQVRKFSQGTWFTFVEDANDRVRSANSVDGICPAPGASNYLDGLEVFSDCVELTLTDGGPNDADGEANGAIRDPSGVAIPASTSTGTTTSPEASTSPGGAGALGWAWLMLLAPLFWLRYRLRQGHKND